MKKRGVLVPTKMGRQLTKKIQKIVIPTLLILIDRNDSSNTLYKLCIMKLLQGFHRYHVTKLTNSNSFD